MSSRTKQKTADYLEYAVDYLKTATYEQATRMYCGILDDPISKEEKDYVISNLCKHDRYFLLTQILRREDAYHPWIYERCREVEREPEDHLDLWSRTHYKSTIITFAGSIQEIIRDPEITIGIFSHTRPISKAFLDQIKQEQEQNELLYYYWPDIFWENPKREAPVWSLDSGIVVKRKSNPKEKTIEAHGLVDGQPVSKHFKLRIYNDVVTEESVTTPEMILKTTSRWELSQNLGILEVEGRKERSRQWHEGTRYHFGDTYGTIISRGALKTRIYPATHDGTYDGKPVLLSDEAWEKKKQSESRKTIACQQLLNPLAGSEADFKLEWMRPYWIRPETLNVAILVDPAGSKKKGSDRTAFSVIGMDYSRNLYLLDGACHKMTLAERWVMLKSLRRKWLNSKGIQVVKVCYEKYGMQSDIEHFKTMMEIEKYTFTINEVSWVRDDSQAKDDRIRRLAPDHENERFYYPVLDMKLDPNSGQWIIDYAAPLHKLQMQAIDQGKPWLVAKPIKRVNEDGFVYNVVEYLVNNEYLFFPATNAKDMMDSMSRVYDSGLTPPRIVNEKELYPESVDNE